MPHALNIVSSCIRISWSHAIAMALTGATVVCRLSRVEMDVKHSCKHCYSYVIREQTCAILYANLMLRRTCQFFMHAQTVCTRKEPGDEATQLISVDCLVPLTEILQPQTLCVLCDKLVVCIASTCL